jgi:transcriptional regulator with XRE-family HTH domain
VDIGKNIRELRKKKGFSQADLGRTLGVSQKVISSYERSYRLPPSSLMPQVAESLGTSTDALYRSSDDDRRAGKLMREELWRIVEKLEGLSEREQKEVFGIIEKYLLKKKRNIGADTGRA